MPYLDFNESCWLKVKLLISIQNLYLRKFQLHSFVNDEMKMFNFQTYVSPMQMQMKFYDCRMNIFY